MSRLLLPFASLALPLAIAGCGDDAKPGCDDTCIQPDASDAPDVALGTCTEGTHYAAGTSAFREVTSEWGLDGVVGTRLSVGDIDGDGWADLFVRRGGATRSNDWGEDGARHSYLLRNDQGRFVDVTRDSGIDDPRGVGSDLGRPYEVVAFGDVDNDGDLDVYTGATTVDDVVARGETSEIMRNSGDGLFSFSASDAAERRAGAIDVPAAATFIDVDRDGWLDLWVPQHNYEPAGGGIAFSQDRFYRGLGDGRFVEATADFGLTTLDWDRTEDLNAARSHTRAWSGVACDLNDDGTPELMAASYGRAPNHLWQGERGADGTVTFSNRSVASGYAYDEDQTWQDNQFARCFCQENPDAEDCEGVEAPIVNCSPNWNHPFDREPFRNGGNSGATVCADLNNDGALDLITTEIKHWWAGDGADQSDILLNTGAADVTFDRELRRELLGFVVRHPTSPSWDEGHMSATVLDFDNDGWPDFYIGASDYPGNSGLLYHQQSPEFFAEVPVADAFEHNRSHGVVAADFDRDGDLDLIVGHSRSRCDESAPNNCYETAQIRAFENTLGDGGNWVQLALTGGEGTNRAAIGARVTVTAGDVTQTQEVGGGYGHYGAQNDMVLHFGLGAACDAEVTVRWPDADLTTESFSVRSGLRYDVPQGGDAAPVE